MRTDDSKAMEPYLKTLNPTKNFHQAMQFTYVVYTNEVLWDDDGTSSPMGEYREYGLEVMCNYPVIITDAYMEVSVDQLPEDFDPDYTSTQYGWDNPFFRPYQSKYGAWGQQVWKSINGVNAITSVSGLREVKGKNILCGTDSDVVGWVDFNGEWKSLSRYTHPDGEITKKTISSPLRFRFRLIENELFTQRRAIAYLNGKTGRYELSTNRAWYRGWKFLGRPHYPDNLSAAGVDEGEVISSYNYANGVPYYNRTALPKDVFNRNLTIIMKPK